MWFLNSEKPRQLGKYGRGAYNPLHDGFYYFIFDETFA